MTAVATIMMIIAMLVVWGGLAVAITYLVRNPLQDDRPDEGTVDEFGHHHL